MSGIRGQSELGDLHPQGTFWMADPSETIEVRSQRPEVNFHRIGAEEAGALAEAMGFESATSVRERFSDGRRCYVSRIEGAIAGYGWVSFEEEWISELGMSLRLEPGDAYIWDCATLPTYRGQGLYPALLTYILSSLWAKGLHRVWIGADTDSVASQKGIARAGFHPIADITLTGDPAPDHFFVSGHPGVPEELVRYIRDGLR